MLALTYSFTWNGPQVKTRERDAAADGLAKAAEHVLGQSQQLVPVETGELLRSAVASVDRDTLRAAVSYGVNGAEAYAVLQHERLDYDHPRGGQAKYLEQPINRESDTIAALVAAEIRRALS